MSYIVIAANLQTALAAEVTIDAAIFGLSRRRAIASDGVLCQIIPSWAGHDRVDSNILYEVYQFDLVISKKLTDGTIATETTYISVEMMNIQNILMQRSFYELGGVHAVHRNPELTLPERVGNVVTFSVDVQLSTLPGA